MKKRFIPIIVIVVIFAVFFGYKIFKMNIYDVKEIQIPKLNIENSSTILNKKLNSADYFTVGNISIKNDFKYFKQVEDNINNKLKSFVLYDENKKIKAGIKFFEDVTYTRGLSESINVFGNAKIKEKDINTFMQNHNFTNDFELIQYLSDLKEEKISIFTSISKMKENYVAHYLANLILVEGDCKELKGDYLGYILEIKDTIEVNIIVGEKKYTVSFVKLDYFTDSYINELISTIKVQ